VPVDDLIELAGRKDSLAMIGVDRNPNGTRKYWTVSHEVAYWVAVYRYLKRLNG
jgi:hypothetical protein